MTRLLRFAKLNSYSRIIRPGCTWHFLFTCINSTLCNPWYIRAWGRGHLKCAILYANICSEGKNAVASRGRRQMFRNYSYFPDSSASCYFCYSPRFRRWNSGRTPRYAVSFISRQSSVRNAESEIVWSSHREWQTIQLVTLSKFNAVFMAVR